MAHAIRTDAIERADQAKIEPANACNGVDAQRARHAFGGCDFRGEPLGQEILQRLDLIPFDGEACRHGVAAARDQQAFGFRRRHRRAEIDAWRGAARTLGRFIGR